MKRALIALALVMIAAVAVGSPNEMSPQQAMETMMNCPVCSAWSAEPALGPTIRYSISTTKTGYVETLSTADESMKPTFDKCAAECEKRAAGVASMPKAEKDKLCAFCAGHVKLMARKDLAFENVNTPLGIVTVATASTPDGVKALHGYAAAAQKQADMMAQAQAMHEGTMKSGM